MLAHVKGRKAALAILAALALLVAASCSSNDDTSGDDTDTTDTTASAESILGEKNEATGTPITIGFVTDGEAAASGSDEERVATFDATVEYINEYLGGLNGHPIEVEHCATDASPTGATQCAITLTEAGVAATLVPGTGQGEALYDGFDGSGIPFVIYTAASGNILAKPGAFLLTNPIVLIVAPGLVAEEDSIDKAGFILIDVPEAVGPITAIATPMFEAIGVELEIYPISPSVADPTPQLQEAIGGGAGVFTVTGTPDFAISGINGLRQLGFEGTIVAGGLVQEVLDALDTYEGLVGVGAQTLDPSDPDVQLMNAIIETYTELDPDDADPNGFATPLAFVRALTDATDAVDAATIMEALSAMPETELPLGAGITFQCGTAPMTAFPNICSSDVLQWTFDDEGNGQDYAVIEVSADVLNPG